MESYLSKKQLKWFSVSIWIMLGLKKITKRYVHFFQKAVWHVVTWKYAHTLDYNRAIHGGRSLLSFGVKIPELLMLTHFHYKLKERSSIIKIICTYLLLFFSMAACKLCVEVSEVNFKNSNSEHRTIMFQSFLFRTLSLYLRCFKVLEIKICSLCW